MLPGQIEDQTSLGNSQRDQGMVTVDKTRCELASLLAGARFSNPERVENTDLEVDVRAGGEGQCVRYKNETNQNGTFDHFISARRLHMRPSLSSTGARLVVLYTNEGPMLRAKRDVHPQARFVKSQDRTAQRPAMARWNRDAGSIYKLRNL